MSYTNGTFMLRLAVSIILLVHSIPTMLDGGINGFGTFYLGQEIGLGMIGLPLAWAIKLSHVATAIGFMTEKFVKPLGVITILIFVMGIVMVHFKEGWFVVGGGRNGVEFNFLLIFATLTIMYPKGLQKD